MVCVPGMRGYAGGGTGRSWRQPHAAAAQASPGTQTRWRSGAPSASGGWASATACEHLSHIYEEACSCPLMLSRSQHLWYGMWWYASSWRFALLTFPKQWRLCHQPCARTSSGLTCTAAQKACAGAGPVQAVPATWQGATCPPPPCSRGTCARTPPPPGRSASRPRPSPAGRK